MKLFCDDCGNYVQVVLIPITLEDIGLTGVRCLGATYVAFVLVAPAKTDTAMFI